MRRYCGIWNRGQYNITATFEEDKVFAGDANNELDVQDITTANKGWRIPGDVTLTQSAYSSSCTYFVQQDYGQPQELLFPNAAAYDPENPDNPGAAEPDHPTISLEHDMIVADVISEDVGNDKANVTIFLVTPDELRTDISDNTEVTFENNSAEIQSVTNNGETLAKDVDYTVEYTDSEGSPVNGVPTAPGSYSVIINGIGAYKGTVSQSFKIPLVIDDDAVISETTVIDADVWVEDASELKVGSSDGKTVLTINGDVYLFNGETAAEGEQEVIHNNTLNLTDSVVIINGNLYVGEFAKINCDDNSGVFVTGSCQMAETAALSEVYNVTVNMQYHPDGDYFTFGSDKTHYAHTGGNGFTAMSVSYKDENGETQTLVPDTDDFGYIESSDKDVTLDGGTYVVSGETVIDGTLNFTGDAVLILEDGASLNVSGGEDGINCQVLADGGNRDYSLMVYGQEKGTGTLTAAGKDYGIWCGDFALYGGNVDCSPNSESDPDYIGLGASKSCTIAGGSFTCDNTGSESESAGILSNGDITISGGKVTAKGTGDNAKGIEAENIVINGGEITSSSYSIDAYSGGKLTLGTHTFCDNTLLQAGDLDKTAVSDLAGKTLKAAYAVSISDSIRNGTVTADTTEGYAAAGQTVTLTIEPADNCALKSLTVMQGETPVTVNDNKFTMPAGDVTVGAEFVISGYCGDNVKWALTKNDDGDDTYTLTISGDGEIDYSSWYSYSSKITKVVIENGVTSIGYQAFFDCGSLTSVTIPNGVTSIEVGVFCECSSLTFVTIPNGVTSIDICAFRDCSSLTSVTIPNSVTSIWNYAFYDCDSLTTVTIPNSVTSIRESAFDSCRKLTTVTVLAENPPALGKKPFFGISDDAKFYVPAKSVDKYKDWANREIIGVYLVTLPEGVTGGTVTADKAFVAADAEDDDKKVTLTVNPDDGYKLKSLTVTDADGNEVDVENNQFTMPDNKDVTVTAEFEEENRNTIIGASLTLNGDIGVNMYFVPSAQLEDGAYILVKGPNDQTPVKRMVSDLPNGDGGSKKVTCLVYAAQMGEIVSFELYNKNDEKLPWYDTNGNEHENFTYSANNYINAVKKDGSKSSELRELAEKMQNYGAWTRQYFGNTTSNIANPVSISGVEADTLFDFRMTRTENYAVEGLELSLVLDSTISIRLYYSGDAENITVSDKAAFTTGQDKDKGKNFVEIKNIAAQNLDRAYTVTFGSKGSVNVSALSFAYSILKAHSENPEKVDICNTVRAMYQYNQAAKEYFVLINS